MTAADVRKHVMTGSLMMLHPASFDMTLPDGSTPQTGQGCDDDYQQAKCRMESGDSYGDDNRFGKHVMDKSELFPHDIVVGLSLLDVVDPCDIEEALAQRRTSALYDISSTTASPRKVSEFPADDVEVRIVPREWTTVDPPVPTETKEYQQFGSADAYVRMLIERPIIVRSTTRPIFEADAGRAERIARSVSVVGDQSSVIEKRSAPPYPEERVGQKLIVKILLGCPNPSGTIFVQGAFRMPLGFMVVDLQKVLMGANSLERSDMTMSTVTAASSGTITGETAAPLASVSGETDSIVSADRVSNTSTSTFRRMGSGTSAAAVLNRVRTPLQRRKFLGGSAAGSEDSSVPDASSVGKSMELNLANLQPVTLNLNSFFRQEADRLSDDDLFKLLADARKPGGKLSRLKTFTADLALQLSGGTGEELLMRLSPEMLRVAPFSGGELTKDIQEFPAKGLYMANTSYRYGYLSPDVALPNVRWLDAHKPAFNLSVTAISTVHPQDEHLERFFIGVNSLSSTDRKKPPVSESALIAAAQGVTKARPEPMVAYLYNVLDKLIALIANRPYSEALSSACFETMGQLVKICTMLLDSCLDMHGRSALLTSYVHYFKIAMKESKARSQLCKEMAAERNKPGSPETQKLFTIIEDMEKASSHQQRVPCEAVPSTSNKSVHEELAELWVRSGGCAREMAFLNSWFFFELMIKSMAEYLSMTGRLYLTRRSRFSERFIRALDSLSAATISEVANVFLTDVALNEFGKPVDKLQNKLRLCFRDFSKKCADALTLNKNLILPDQLAYQSELQKNYVEFTRRMAPIIGGGGNRHERKEVTTGAEHAVAVAAEIGPVTSV
ncbi:dedicator of cytokinesis [Ancylostoma ceylanicum]|uniref:Dedicator of cytokinesis n=1 Tax=Ancylostoma ceylanicum TaxID=53326 RepID=A0A0D6L918_9BILA|nr:dedicator of cytokinesis [Ancylostoma ceylanicum]